MWSLPFKILYILLTTPLHATCPAYSMDVSLYFRIFLHPLTELLDYKNVVHPKNKLYYKFIKDSNTC
jgi:hypothetical protein